MANLLIGIDVGGTNIKIGCFDTRLNLLKKISITTDADSGPQAVVEKMLAAVDKLVKECGFTSSDISAAGIGTPGPADYTAGILTNPTNMPAFKNVPIRQMLSDALHCPVVFDNDANVACFGEFAAGAGKGVTDMVFFTLGTGIGAGIVSEGKLLRGFDGNAAELGHTIIYPDGRLCNCGQKGCAEAYASASNTAKRATEALNAGENSSLKKVLDKSGQITCEDVYDHLKTGDKLAKKITDETAKALAILCINALHTADPQRIVFAGGMIAAGDILLNRIKDYFNEQVWKLKKETVEICFATLGEDAGIIGAAALAKNN
ncbi:MAG: ROK family protein [Phycisphaerae bacterium]|nr:ROK family protein [Phycisphaerae bacterium]MDD5381095.1 ROK family protein [Phycisphaerae bacterium]